MSTCVFICLSIMEASSCPSEYFHAHSIWDFHAGHENTYPGIRKARCSGSRRHSLKAPKLEPFYHLDLLRVKKLFALPSSNGSIHPSSFHQLFWDPGAKALAAGLLPFLETGLRKSIKAVQYALRGFGASEKKKQ